MNTATIETPNITGAAFGGGLYAGRICVGAQPFALVLAPKDEGEYEPTRWHKSLTKVSGANSWCDGSSNTAAMAAAGSPLAKWVRDLRIGGHDDWYLPSRLDALVVGSELPNEFKRAWYWTSTQYAPAPDFAWTQNFWSNFQSYDYKYAGLRARAVRRVPL